MPVRPGYWGHISTESSGGHTMVWSSNSTGFDVLYDSINGKYIAKKKKPPEEKTAVDLAAEELAKALGVKNAG